jgi:hypothetical protein
MLGGRLAIPFNVQEGQRPWKCPSIDIWNCWVLERGVAAKTDDENRVWIRMPFDGAARLLQFVGTRSDAVVRGDRQDREADKRQNRPTSHAPSIKENIAVF